MHHAQIIQEICHAWIGIEQIQFQFFSACRNLFAIGVPKRETGQDTEKSAVHRDAFTQIENKMADALIAEFVDESFKINAGAEIRAPGKLDESHLLYHRYGHHWSFGGHSDYLLQREDQAALAVGMP